MIVTKRKLFLEGNDDERYPDEPTTECTGATDQPNAETPNFKEAETLTQRIFPFLKLPGELRNKIYGYIVKRDYPVMADYHFFLAKELYVEPIFSVCKQIYDEVKGVFWKVNVFTFVNVDQRSVAEFKAAYGVGYDTIRSIEVHITKEYLLDSSILHFGPLSECSSLRSLCLSISGCLFSFEWLDWHRVDAITLALPTLDALKTIVVSVETISSLEMLDIQVSYERSKHGLRYERKGGNLVLVSRKVFEFGRGWKVLYRAADGGKEPTLRKM